MERSETPVTPLRVLRDENNPFFGCPFDTSEGSFLSVGPFLRLFRPLTPSLPEICLTNPRVLPLATSTLDFVLLYFCRDSSRVPFLKVCHCESQFLGFCPGPRWSNPFCLWSPPVCTTLSESRCPCPRVAGTLGHRGGRTSGSSLGHYRRTSPGRGSRVKGRSDVYVGRP